MIRIIEKNIGQIGNLISFSKSNYRKNHPNNIVVFNANIIVDGSKIWYGDIDVSISKMELLNLSKELNKTLYVLYEMDARYDKENNPNIDNYVVMINPDETIKLHKRLKEYYKI